VLGLVNLFACPVLADDNATRWGGGYVGFHAGDIWNDFGNGGTAAGPDGSDNSLMGGVQIGDNMQINHLVFGLEADASKMDLISHNNTATFNEDYMFTLRGRAGYAIDQILPYVTAGAAFTDAISKAPGQGESSRLQPGAAVGAGMDIAMDNWTGGTWANSGKWFGRVEYLHVEVPKDSTQVGATSVRGGSENNLIRVGLNYKF